MDISSAKYSVEISENEVTNTINVGTRFLVKHRAFEVSLVDDFTIKNVRTLTICETVINSYDDIDFDVAYNDNSDIEDVLNPYIEIVGSDSILLGDTSSYEMKDAINWEIEGKGLSIISNELGKCEVKSESNVIFVGSTVKLKALDKDDNVISEKNIYVKGFF